MKHFIIIIVLALTLPLASKANAQGKSIPGTQISLLISEYKAYDGFEAVKVGRLGTGILKSLISSGAVEGNDPDIKDFKRLMKGIKKLALVDYSDCDPEVRQGFSKKMTRLLDGVDMLMEVKYDNTRTRSHASLRNPDEIKLKSEIELFAELFEAQSGPKKTPVGSAFSAISA